MRTGLPSPVLSALVIAGDGGAAQAAVWCPWCEAVHWHGAAPGSRVAHCLPSRRSPFCTTGYEIAVVGSAATVKAVVPTTPMAGGPRLEQVADGAAGPLRAVLGAHLLGLGLRGRSRGPVMRKRTATGTAWIFGADGWLIEADGRSVEGNGFLRLAAALYGVPAGVAAVRILEAVTFDRLDATAVLEIQDVVDRWTARRASTDGGARR